MSTPKHASKGRGRGRPRRDFPSYRLHKASGQAIVTLNGHDVYLGHYDTPESRQAYDRAIAEWLVGGREPKADGDGMTVGELVPAYMEWAEKSSKAGRSDTGCSAFISEPSCRSRPEMSTEPTLQIT